eukprot:6458017-Alexandrium_andersonii.AAC.1
MGGMEPPSHAATLNSGLWCPPTSERPSGATSGLPAGRMGIPLPGLRRRARRAGHVPSHVQSVWRSGLLRHFADGPGRS